MHPTRRKVALVRIEPTGPTFPLRHVELLSLARRLALECQGMIRRAMADAAWCVGLALILIAATLIGFWSRR
jgi:hypothetical protein